MRCEMNVAVKAVQAVDGAAKGGEKPTVKVHPPVRWHDGVRGAFRGEPMSEVIDFRVRDARSRTVDRATSAACTPSSPTPPRRRCAPRALTVQAGGLEKRWTLLMR